MTIAGIIRQSEAAKARGILAVGCTVKCRFRTVSVGGMDFRGVACHVIVSARDRQLYNYSTVV